MKALSEPMISGPRSLRDPRSREYAIQTIRSLKRYLESKSIDAKGVERELQEIKRHKHWQVLGFKDLDAYLRAEVGVTHKQLTARLAQDLAADPAVTAAPKHVGRGHRSDNITPNRGTDAAYLIRRLKRDAPEIAEALARGEYRSARAAAIAAGIITPPTTLEKILKLLPKLTATERRQLRARLAEMAQRAERDRAA